MANITFANFKNGYDKRRSELTTQAGSLLLLQDMFVNEGAELEKRKAWQNANFRPVNTFGLETTPNGVLIFSSGYFFTATATRARDALGNVTLTLTAPSYSAGGTYTLQYTFNGQLYLWTPGPNDTELVDGSTTLMAVNGPQQFTSTGTTTLHGTNNALITAKVTYVNLPLIPNIVPGNAPIFGQNSSQADTIVVTGMADAAVNGTWILTSQVGLTLVFATPTTGSAYSSTPDVAGVVIWDSTVGLGNVYIQTLIHPAVTDGATYNHLYHDMVKVNCSTAFGSGAWVAATYTDGNTFVFWNGNYVAAFRNGRVLFGWSSNQDIATQVRNYINSLALTGYSVGAVTSDGSGGYYFNVQSPYGNTDSWVGVATSAAGTLTPTLVSTGFAPVTAIASSAGFTIAAATGGSVTGVFTSQDSYVTNLLQATVNFTTTAQQLANDVAASIATNASASVNFTAVASGPTVTVSDKTNAGSTPNGLHLKVVVSGAICIDNIPFNFTSAWASADNVTNIKWDSTGANVEILGATITMGSAGHVGESLLQYVGRIATQIQTYATTAGAYTAVALASSTPTGSVNLFISRTTVTSATSIAAESSAITFTSASGAITNGLSGGTTTTTSPMTAVFTGPPSISGTSGIFQVAVVISGGVGTKTYNWTNASYRNNTTKPNMIVNATVSSGQGTATVTYTWTANEFVSNVPVMGSLNVTDSVGNVGNFTF